MSIRLNKAIKEFNVGLQNIVDYLNANGGSLKGDPNEKINDEQYALLQKQFGADKALHDEAAKIFSKPEKPNKEEVAAEPAVVEEVAAPAAPEKVETPVKEEAPKAKKAAVKKEEVPAPVVEETPAPAPVPVVEEKPEPKPAKKEKPSVEERAAALLTESEDGVFKLRNQPEVSGPK
ncbi:MAG: hypothetical protein U0L77_04255, partial [Prevotellamassilia sp.]|nr:hypothetical protein [Prevotellamassilia sp.]